MYYLTVMRYIKSSDAISLPSLASGVSNIFNVFGSIRDIREDRSALEMDKKATQNDWKMIGSDLFTSMKRYEKTR